MKTDEFQQLTSDNVTRVLAGRRPAGPEQGPADRRRAPRWPFPGPIELWVPLPGGPADETQHVLGTTRDLSTSGVGLYCDCELPVGDTLAIAIHEPEATLHGEAIVRRCQPCPGGFSVGLEFVR